MKWARRKLRSWRKRLRDWELGSMRAACRSNRSIGPDPTRTTGAVASEREFKIGGED